MSHAKSHVFFRTVVIRAEIANPFELKNVTYFCVSERLINENSINHGQGILKVSYLSNSTCCIEMQSNLVAIIQNAARNLSRIFVQKSKEIIEVNR